MITTKKLWTKDKQDCIEYTMSNQLIEVKALNYGGVITSFKLFNSDKNVVVAYDDKSLYKENPFYLGSHIGPVAGRVKNGQFEMDGETVQLEVNDNENHLHGGSTRLDHLFFETLYEDDDRFPALVFIRTVDYDETDSGYKGQVKYIITMKLVANTLMINHKAFPTHKMPINMVNHMYFNLQQSNSVLDHVMEVGANNILELDENMAYTSETISVVNTAFDFRTANIIGSRIKKGHPQFDITRNIDHFFVLEEKKTVTLFDPESQQAINITTTGDGVVLYLANYFDEQFINESKVPAKNQSAIAIEPCHFPLNIGKDQFYDATTPFDMTTTYVLKKTR
jgi:aldose 1-epimerase